MIARLQCWLFGHRRGKFHCNVMEQGSTKIIARKFLCPRCEATWQRKVKA